MKDRPPREPKDTKKEEVLFDYDRLQERKRRSRFIAYAVFLDDEDN